MEFETLKVAVDGRIGRLTLNQPEKLNALGAATLRELVDAARWFDGQTDVRVVILRGEGRAFSAGADLQDPSLVRASPESGLPWHERREVGQLGRRMMEAVEQMRATTIAEVHGYAIGGALLLMMACDLRVVAERTIFSIPEIDIGIPLAWGGIPRLVREIGPALTKELVMTCRRFTPAEAKAAGLVNRVVPEGALADEAEGLAAELAGKPSVPIIITKEHVNAVSRAMGAGITDFADGDALVGVGLDLASREAALAYFQRTFKK